MNSDEANIHQESEQPNLAEEKQMPQQPIVEASDPSTVEDENLNAEASTVEDENSESLIPISLSLPTDSDSTLEQIDLNSPLSELQQAAEVEPEANLESDDTRQVADLTETVAKLQRQEQELRERIATLQERESKILSDHLAQTQAAVERMLQEGVTELEQRKQSLQVSLEQLERRRERIRAEMRTSFAGTSQDIAIRVQGFKDYLVGSLQDLASAAEQLDLAPQSQPQKPIIEEVRPAATQDKILTPKFAEQGFQEQARQIRKILDQYRTLPDYYGPPWQLRRTFEPVHAERVANWFFTQGGRGAIKTMGSRLQNVLIASATISVLRTLYGDRLRTLIIANTPERLGEWRRGMQDCLGISRSDFGPERGIVLFEEPSALVQKADRLLTQKQLPLVLIDETEELINLSLLQFPLWLAFAPDPQQMSTNYQY